MTISTPPFLVFCRRAVSKIVRWLTGKPPTCAEAEYGWNLVLPKRLFSMADRGLWESECRRLAFNARLADDEVLCRALGRYKMIVDARDEGLAPNLIADGFWEIWITAFILRTVQPGMVCIDAGANIGYYTVMMAEQAKTTGRVIAAEPVPKTFHLLSKNTRMNDFMNNMEILNVAFGAEAGQTTLAVPRVDPKNASMFLNTVDVDPEHFDLIQATVTPIDDLDLPRVDFVKIDVEGAEPLVWKGMQQTIARSPDIQIVMEVNAQRMADDGLLDEIAALFPLRAIDHYGKAVPTTIEKIKADPHDVMLYLTRR